jgi:hypothetical protein
VYTGFLDVANQTLAREGWQGLYKGLVPTLAKVVPAVSISYVVSRCRIGAGFLLTIALHRFTNTASDPCTLLDSIESYNEQPYIRAFDVRCTNDDTRTDFNRLFTCDIPHVYPMCGRDVLIMANRRYAIGGNQLGSQLSVPSPHGLVHSKPFRWAEVRKRSSRRHISPSVKFPLRVGRLSTETQPCRRTWICRNLLPR